DRDAVDPCLELRRDAKIVHGCPDHQDVRGQKLVDNRAVGEAVERKVRQWFRDQVAPNHSRAGHNSLELVHDRFAYCAAHAAFAANAAVDMQDSHWILRFSVNRSRALLAAILLTLSPSIEARLTG